VKVIILELKEIFLRIASVGAPSGYEEPMIRALKSELAPYVDEVHDTPRGNVVGVKRGTDKDAPSVALVAHMDQIGFTVHNIDDRGFLRFRRIGGPVIRAIQGQQVRILTEKGPVPGVVGVKPGHITTPEEAMTVPQIEEMYIDMGAWSREEAEAMGVKVGTPIVSGAAPVELANGLIASPGVDDRGGVATLIGVAEALKGERLLSTVYYVGTVEEEMGLRGAAVALFDLDVDLAVAIDTCAAGYQPDVNMMEIVYEIGKGPAIHVGEVDRTNVRAVHHHKVREWLVEAAEAEGIPYQSAFMHGGTDAKATAQTRGGIPSSTIGLPRRYSHSPVELFDLKDLENIVKILVAALKRLGPGFRLLRA
jgi:putative aminopeptidase FrvX